MEQMKRLPRTQSLHDAIWNFGIMSYEQAKAFIPPYLDQDKKEIPITEKDAEKLISQLRTQRTIFTDGADLIYPYLSDGRTPVVFDQGKLDAGWVFLDYLQKNYPELPAHEAVKSAFFPKDDASVAVMLLPDNMMVHVCPVYSDEDIARINSKAIGYEPDETVKFLAFSRDPEYLKKLGEVNTVLPISYVLIAGGDGRNRPDSVRYLKKKKA